MNMGNVLNVIIVTSVLAKYKCCMYTHLQSLYKKIQKLIQFIYALRQTFLEALPLNHFWCKVDFNRYFLSVKKEQLSC